VQGKDENGANGRVLRFTVKPGRRYASAELRFPGIKVLSESKLREAVGGAEAVIGSERNAKEAVRAAYAEANHLAAEAGPLGLREEGDRFVIELPVQEGPRARIASVDVDGSTLPAEETAAALRLETGADFDENDVTRAGQRLRDHYIALGYPKVRVTFDSAVAGTDVAVRYRVVEGPQLRIGAMEVTGATRTRRSLILGQFALKPGDVLDLRKLAAGERKLRALGLFRRVATRYTDSSPAVLTIEVEEQALVAARYQLRYNQEDGVTAEIEPVLQNVLGSGITLGGRYRRGADVDERRGSLDFPSIFRGHFVATLFRLFERVPGGTDFDGNLVENEDTQRGFQVQQSTPLPNRWNLLLGYRFKRVTTESPLLESPVEFDIAALDFSLLRETRDNPVDSRRGRFWSLTLELSPQALGSEVTFAKAFFQAFFARPVSPTLTWAQGYRLGLAKGFNRQEVISSERFRAGGANSLRGFETDSVGPRDEFVNSPLGGDAVVILNQELRYRHHTGLGAVAFYDGGNVFARVSDLSFDLRHVLGGGLRYASPVGLLRLDLGFPLFRKPGESSYQLFFSFGQAF
jgi:outer membrane protein insertion porin family